MEAEVGAEARSRDKQRDYSSVLHHSLSSGWPLTVGEADRGEKKKRLTHGHSHSACGGGLSLIPSKTEKLAINLFQPPRPGSFSIFIPIVGRLCNIWSRTVPAARRRTPPPFKQNGRRKSSLFFIHFHGRLVWYDVESNH